ncbi:MAG: rhodanese-like domain-containing protein [Turicibacter sp.]|nr:rhodanese-like domain-containing protein [Turicibacter sp.]
MPATITLQALKQLNQPNMHIIDIRPRCEYETGHLPNALNIPYEILMTYPDAYLKKDHFYYLICAHGSLSHRACAILKAYGYQVANVQNGYDMRYFYC